MVKKKNADRTQVSKIALPSAFDVRALLYWKHMIEVGKRGEKGKEEISKARDQNR